MLIINIILIDYFINRNMSDSEKGQYPRHKIIYHTNAGTVPNAITLHNMSILEAVPDKEYIPNIKTVSFILEKLNNANQQTLIKLYNIDFFYGSSS